MLMAAWGLKRQKAALQQDAFTNWRAHTKSLVFTFLFSKLEMFFLSFSDGQLKNESMPHFQQFASQKNKVKKDIYSSNLK